MYLAGILFLDDEFVYMYHQQNRIREASGSGYVVNCVESVKSINNMYILFQGKRQDFPDHVTMHSDVKNHVRSFVYARCG